MFYGTAAVSTFLFILTVIGTTPRFLWAEPICRGSRGASWLHCTHLTTDVPFYQRKTNVSVLLRTDTLRGTQTSRPSSWSGCFRFRTWVKAGCVWICLKSLFSLFKPGTSVFMGCGFAAVYANTQFKVQLQPVGHKESIRLQHKQLQAAENFFSANIRAIKTQFGCSDLLPGVHWICFYSYI